MDIFDDLSKEIQVAESNYGSFTSTHEALGVVTEEYFELIAAIRKNDAASISIEAIQVAAACMRLADQVESSGKFYGGRSKL